MSYNLAWSLNQYTMNYNKKVLEEMNAGINERYNQIIEEILCFKNANGESFTFCTRILDVDRIKDETILNIEPKNLFLFVMSVIKKIEKDGFKVTILNKDDYLVEISWF